MQINDIINTCKTFVVDHNWPSNYTYYGRYQDIGVTEKIIEYSKKTGKNNLSILDVGCSIGLASKQMQYDLLLHTEITTHVTGIDVKEKVADEAVINLDNFILGDFLKTEIKQCFDVIICTRMMVAEYAYRKANIVYRCAELLKPNGCLITDAYSYEFSNDYQKFEKDVKDLAKMLSRLRFGFKAWSEEMKNIRKQHLKRKTKIFYGKDEALQYSNKIISNWQKMDIGSKSLDIFCSIISKLLAFGNKPKYTKPLIRG